MSEQYILLDFTATWCGPCKALAPIIDKIKEDNPWLYVDKIDVDSDMGQDLSKKYNVRGVPTMVLIKDGVELHRLVGSMPITKIVSEFKQFADAFI